MGAGLQARPAEQKAPRSQLSLLPGGLRQTGRSRERPFLFAQSLDVTFPLRAILLPIFSGGGNAPRSLRSSFLRGLRGTSAGAICVCPDRPASCGPPSGVPAVVLSAASLSVRACSSAGSLELPSPTGRNATCRASQFKDSTARDGPSVLNCVDTGRSATCKHGLGPGGRFRSVNRDSS